MGVGNRVEKTMKRDDLKARIGEHWFFPTVHEAVQYCLQHKRAVELRRPSAVSALHSSTVVNAPVRVALADEIGISNEIHHDSTTVSVNVNQQAWNLLSSITSILSAAKVSVVRAHVEPHATGSSHTYCVRSESGGKLTDLEMARLREDLEDLLRTLRVESGKVVEDGTAFEALKCEDQLQEKFEGNQAEP